MDTCQLVETSNSTCGSARETYVYYECGQKAGEQPELTVDSIDHRPVRTETAPVDGDSTGKKGTRAKKEQ